MAKLPHKMLDQATLANMRVGDVRYTMHWAMWVDSDMECWLHPEYPAHGHPHGTVEMRVERQPNGYHVRVQEGEAYRPQDKPGFVSSEGALWLPVAEVTHA